MDELYEGVVNNIKTKRAWLLWYSYILSESTMQSEETRHINTLKHEKTWWPRIVKVLQLTHVSRDSLTDTEWEIADTLSSTNIEHYNRI